MTVPGQTPDGRFTKQRVTATKITPAGLVELGKALPACDLVTRG